jgi:Domain of Unknown Function (DUF928)
LGILILFILARQVSGQQQQPPSTPPKEGTAPVQDPKPAQRPVKRVHVALAGFELDKPAPAGSGTQIGGATRGIGASMTLLAPRSARLYGGHPVFQWSYPAQATNFIFELFDEKDTLLYKTRGNARTLRYPESAPPLQPGAVYQWTVRPEGGVLGGASETLKFTRVPQTEIAAISRELEKTGTKEKSDVLRAAQIFTDHRLWFDAVQAYTDLIKSYPQDPELYEKRGTIYDQIPATAELADQDFATAAQLGGSDNK